jgi:HPt (histidine-containing phosphotransfer) domain-containing protein
MNTISNIQQHDAHAHLDVDVVQKLRAIGTRADEDTFVQNLIARFIQTTPERLQLLQDAVAAGDCETIEFQAHTMKSSCGYVGATVMVEVCKMLESLARAGDIGDAGRLVEELQKSFELVTPRLERLLTGSDDRSLETAGNGESVDG